jgi:hypothetical protein
MNICKLRPKKFYNIGQVFRLTWKCLTMSNALAYYNPKKFLYDRHLGNVRGEFGLAVKDKLIIYLRPVYTHNLKCLDAQFQCDFYISVESDYNIYPVIACVNNTYQNTLLSFQPKFKLTQL